MTSFSDRFFWARHKAGIGAPTLADKVGCAQALISSIERRKDAKGSQYNDKFAKAFGVDPNWLRTGEGPPPPGFSPTEARRLREAGARKGSRVSSLHDLATPRWATAPIGEDAPSDEDRAAALQKAIFSNFQDYAALVGPEQTKAFIEILGRLALLSAGEKSGRDKNSGPLS